MLSPLMRGWRAGAAMMLPLALAACGTSPSSPSSPSPTAKAAVSAIAAHVDAPAANCAQFAAGSLPALPRITATAPGGVISALAPSTFDYWVRVTALTSGPVHLAMTETTAGADVTLNAIGGSVLVGSGGKAATCAPISSSVFYPTGSATVVFVETAQSTYYVQVEYSALALTGHRTGSPAIKATISTAGVAGSDAVVSVVAG